MGGRSRRWTGVEKGIVDGVERREGADVLIAVTRDFASSDEFSRIKRLQLSQTGRRFFANV